jgi:hypothetical protein
MVTTEILQSLGYSSLREYFERIYTFQQFGHCGSDVVDFMLDELSEEQQAEYDEFATAYYYEYHDNKDNDNIVPTEQRYSSITAEVHEYEVCFYWLDTKGYESIPNIYEWTQADFNNRRAFEVGSQQEADKLISDKQFLNNYIK